MSPRILITLSVVLILLGRLAIGCEVAPEPMVGGEDDDPWSDDDATGDDDTTASGDDDSTPGDDDDSSGDDDDSAAGR